MTDKNTEVLVCDASIMKNVWEIRLRENKQKMKLEQERLERSALQRINEDWARRMSGKVKPRRVLRRDKKTPEESPAQKYKAKKMSLGRPSGFANRRPQREADVKKVVLKRNNLDLLLGLNGKQPGLMVWTKSWKFSQTLPQPDQMPPVSDWGQSWKILNLQPDNEGQSRMQYEHDTNNNITLDGVLLPFEKALYSLNFEENLSVNYWENSWKYIKQRKTAQRNGHNDQRQEKHNMLHETYSFNEETSPSEWIESWKTEKPPKDHIKIVKSSVNQEGIEIKNEQKKAVMPWGQSWKHFKKELHMKSMKSTSVPLGWADSWRLSKPMFQILQQEKISNMSEPKINMNEQPLDSKIHQTIMDASKVEKYRKLWSSQFQGKYLPLPEWQKSWITIKNLSEQQTMEKQSEEKIQPEIKQVDPLIYGEFKVFSVPKKSKPAEILKLISNWKDSWMSLKNQCSQDRIQSTLQRVSLPIQCATPQATLTDWAKSWRCTNLNANQDSNHWQRGWFAYIRNRSERWVIEDETLNEGIPYNGPTEACGWCESWRFTRHEHCVEKEVTQSTHPPVQQAHIGIIHTKHFLADWEQSCQFSTNTFHNDRPSNMEWSDSWRFCSFHHEDWMEHLLALNYQEKSTKKKLPCPLHRISLSFEPPTFKEMFPPHEWKNSWRMKMSEGKKPAKSGLNHLKKTEILQSWVDSWMFSNMQLYKSSSIHDHSVARVTQYESISEWGRLWKIANPQPSKNIAWWPDAKPNMCNPLHMVFWTQYKYSDYLFTPLFKEYATLRKWGKAWRFMKQESKLDMKSAISQSKCEDDSVIMSKTINAKKHMHFQMDRKAIQVKQWADACKLAKTQPRARHDARHQTDHGRDEDEAMFAEWAESWRFVSESLIAEPVKMTDWKDSWKLLLKPYTPRNGPKKTRGRF